jgi:hypothetical protein
MRKLIYAAFGLLLGASPSAGEEWTLDRRTDGSSRSCTLSRVDRGRPFSLTLAFLADTADQAMVRLSFSEPKLIQGAKKSLATLDFDNGTSEVHRVEAAPDGAILIPIVALNVEDVLQTFSESQRLTVATRFGSTSFSLGGIANRISALRDCASS